MTVEVVVISMCASDPDYLQSIADFLYSPNRINVAISRAKTKAIVVSGPSIFDIIPQTFAGLNARNICKKILTLDLCQVIPFKSNKYR